MTNLWNLNEQISELCFHCERVSHKFKTASSKIYRIIIEWLHPRWTLLSSLAPYHCLQRARFGHGCCVEASPKGIERYISWCILLSAHNLFSCSFIHLELKHDWAIQNEGCRGKNRTEMLKWILKNDSENPIFSRFANLFLHNFHANWRCS